MQKPQLQASRLYHYRHLELWPRLFSFIFIIFSVLTVAYLGEQVSAQETGASSNPIHNQFTPTAEFTTHHSIHPHHSNSPPSYNSPPIIQFTTITQFTTHHSIHHHHKMLPHHPTPKHRPVKRNIHYSRYRHL